MTTKDLSTDLTIEKLSTLVKDKKVTAIKLKDGQTKRLFVCSKGNLCYFAKKSSRRGFWVGQRDLENIDTLVEAVVIDKDQAIYKKIEKYRKYAMKAKITTHFIEDCKKLPATFDEWVAAGKKRLYESGITTGQSQDGTVVTIAAIEKVYPGITERIRRALEFKSNFSTSRFDFRNYDGSIEVKHNEDGTLANVWFSMEYRGCGNGHYYLIINEDAFIYYSKD